MSLMEKTQFLDKFPLDISQSAVGSECNGKELITFRKKEESF